MADKKSFLKLIQNQRKEKSYEKFDGTFLDYLERIKENPDLLIFK